MPRPLLGPSGPTSSSTSAGAPVDRSSVPAVASDTRESRDQSGEGPPVFLEPNALNERSMRDMGFGPSPSRATRPGVLRRPIDAQPSLEVPEQLFQPGIFLQMPMSPPIGYTGPSSVLPTEVQESDHFIPIEDRWRIGYPDWDRYGKGHPILDDYPYLSGRWFDPFNQNVFKGDYPILGQHTFLELTAQANLDFEGRQVPTQTSGSRARSGSVFGKLFRTAQQFLHAGLFLLFRGSVPRYRSVQAGGLADQADSDPWDQ